MQFTPLAVAKGAMELSLPAPRADLHGTVIAWYSSAQYQECVSSRREYKVGSPREAHGWPHTQCATPAATLGLGAAMRSMRVTGFCTTRTLRSRSTSLSRSPISLAPVLCCGDSNRQSQERGCNLCHSNQEHRDSVAASRSGIGRVVRLATARRRAPRGSTGE